MEEYSYIKTIIVHTMPKKIYIDTNKNTKCLPRTNSVTLKLFDYNSNTFDSLVKSLILHNTLS